MQFEVHSRYELTLVCQKRRKEKGKGELNSQMSDITLDKIIAGPL